MCKRLHTYTRLSTIKTTMKQKKKSLATFAVKIMAATGLLLSFASCEKGPDAPTTDNWATSQTVLQSKSSKRGACYSFQIPEEDCRLLGPGISWSYNWGASNSDDKATEFKKYEIDFCPMAWNANPNSLNQIRQYVAKHPECKYLLGYNEPNLTDQADMTPAEAAQHWPEVEALAEELGLQLIAPAMNYGTLQGYGDPVVWLDEFFNLIGGTDKIAGLSIHWYSNADGTDMKGYVEKFLKYGKPIWVTEFCGTGKNESTQMNYMCNAAGYLEACPEVFRYSWFMPRGSGAGWGANATVFNLLEGGVQSYLTDLGKVYVNMSTLDQNVYYPAGSMVPAEHYSATHLSEDLSKDAIQVRPSEDPENQDDNNLDVYNFNYTDVSGSKWMEYGLNAAEAGNYTFQFRYKAHKLIAPKVEFFIDGESKGEFEWPSAEGEWSNFEIEIPLKQGNQRLRIQVNEGIITNLNWFRFAKG